ncbi:hypothetical protein KIPB_014977, partial [Kipferlia bialata]|eukprot:g14977.t1
MNDTRKAEELINELRGDPISVGRIEELINESHAIVSQNVGPNLYATILSIVDINQLTPGTPVLLHQRTMHVVGVLKNDEDPL